MPRQRVQSDMISLSDMVGKYPDYALMALYGKSQAGKTTLGIQMMYEISHKTKRPALLYDTEGGIEAFVDAWHDKLIKRYPDAKIDIRYQRDIWDILRDHGQMVKIKQSADDKKTEKAMMNTSGKLSTVLLKEMDGDSPMKKLVLKNNYSAIMYDSFTMPFKWYGTNQQNFPARGDAQYLLLKDIQKLQDLNTDDKLPSSRIILVNCHATKNPTNKYVIEEMSGGEAIQYNCKVILFLRYAQPELRLRYRRLILMRHPAKEANKHSGILKLTDDKCFVDYPAEVMEEEIEKLKKGKKK